MKEPSSVPGVELVELLPLPPAELLDELHPEGGEEPLAVRGEHTTLQILPFKLLNSVIVSHRVTWCIARKQQVQETTGNCPRK